MPGIYDSITNGRTSLFSRPSKDSDSKKSDTSAQTTKHPALAPLDASLSAKDQLQSVRDALARDAAERGTPGKMPPRGTEYALLLLLPRTPRPRTVKAPASPSHQAPDANG